MCKTAYERIPKRVRRESPWKLFQRYRGSKTPEGGWSWENFHQTEAGRQLNRDLVNVQRFARGRGQTILDEKLRKYFKASIERVISQALRISRSVYGVREPESFNIPIYSHEALWLQAIEEEMARAGHELTVEMSPTVQSVATDAYIKVGTLLTEVDEWTPLPAQQAEFNQRIRTLGSRITGINETTRARMTETILRGVREGDGPLTVAETLRNQGSVAQSRVATIARTEMGNAADIGTKMGMKHAGGVSHLSVIGCEGVELASPHIDGMPTCNISNVPIWREDELVFHPNHTGAIIASGFFDENGQPPPLRMYAFPYTGPIRRR